MLNQTGKRSFQLDRTGNSLISGGDQDLAACACDLGYGVGVIAALRLTHLIPAAGARLPDPPGQGIYFSAVVLAFLRGHDLREHGALDPCSAATHGPHRRIQLACTSWTPPRPRLRRADGACVARLLACSSHRTLAVARWDLGLLGVRLRATVTGRGGGIRRFLNARSSPVFLNLGAGPRGVDNAHWINVDAAPAPAVRFLIDFRRPLPFADASLDGVFCEHVLEHFGQEDGERLVREVGRILRPGGVFRVIVPDAEYVLRSYFESPDELVAARGDGQGTAMEMVNSYFRQRYEHQFMYDWATLAGVLLRAGFTDVVRSGFVNRAGARGCRIDDQGHERESLYVEARTTAAPSAAV